MRLSSFKKRGLSNSIANNAFKFLRVMLEEAKLQGIIKANPCKEVKSLPKEEKEIDIITPEEERALFPARWHNVWDDETQYVLNKLAVCTSMRLGNCWSCSVNIFMTVTYP
jgi:hypothetical protein